MKGYWVNARRWVAVLALLCGLSLGVGIPLLGLTALPHTEVVEGYVVWVRPDDRALLLYDAGPHDRFRGRNIMIYLPAHRTVTVQPGNQPVSVLRPGYLIRVRISRRSHWAHEITIERSL